MNLPMNLSSAVLLLLPEIQGKFTKKKFKLPKISQSFKNKVHLLPSMSFHSLP
jgi:hypothetical protein